MNIFTLNEEDLYYVLCLGNKCKSAFYDSSRSTAQRNFNEHIRSFFSGKIPQCHYPWKEYDSVMPFTRN